jgi:putative ABC transport system permease protein
VKRSRLALRLLARDWRAGEVRLLAVAVIVAVAAVSAVSWLADRVAGASGARAAELLAADRVVQTAEPIPAGWMAEAQAVGLTVARTAEFPSVVLAGDQPQLVAVKAVEAPYPLRGTLQLQAAVGGAVEQVRAVPEAGTAWVETRLLGPLGLDLGGQVSLGQSAFTITRLLALEPDRGGFFTSLAPRVMINYADLPATGLIQPGSRVRYQLLLAGPEPALERFRQWLPTDRPGLEWRTPQDAGIGVREVIQRAERFLGLAALLTVVIAGVAILLTVRRYAERQVDRVAIMRCLGATAGDVTALVAWKLTWLALFSGAVGVGLGYLLHLAMLGLVADLLPPRVPAPGLYPALSGWLTAFAALLGFALPTVLRLRQVPPLRVLRRELGGGLFGGNALYAIALGAIFLLMWWQAADPLLAGLVFAAVLGALALLALLAWSIVRGLMRLRAGRQRLLWLSGITRRPATATVQIVAIGVGLMALLLLTLVREDLLSAWEERIPPDAPNYFLINVQPDQVAAVRELLERQAGVEPQFYPMIRGRLIAINDREVRPEQYEDRAQRLVAREFNLSYGQRPPSDNRIVTGRWWESPAEEAQQFSVEVGLAEELGIQLGDTLHFMIGGEQASGVVTSLREVQWDSFNVNFFVMSPPGLLDDYPTTYITSFYLPPENQPLLAELVRGFPSITVFDINSILTTVRGIMAQGARVVELMASLTLAAGVVVLLAALQTTGEERRFESALLRALGAKRSHIKRMARAEFWLIGAAAGGLAGACAAVAGLVMARQLFELDYALDPLPLVAGLIIGPLVVWLAGAWATRRFYRAAPMRLLRGPAGD